MGSTRRQPSQRGDGSGYERPEESSPISPERSAAALPWPAWLRAPRSWQLKDVGQRGPQSIRKGGDRAQGQVLATSLNGLDVPHGLPELVRQRLLGQAARFPQLGEAPANVVNQPVGTNGHGRK